MDLNLRKSWLNSVLNNRNFLTFNEKDSLEEEEWKVIIISLKAFNRWISIEDLKKLFSPFGQITNYKIRNKVAFIRFSDPFSGKRVVQANISLGPDKLEIKHMQFKESVLMFLNSKLNHEKILDELLSCQSVEEQIHVLFKEVAISPQDFERREQLRKYLEDFLHSVNYPGCELIFSGSTVNTVGFKDSDMDIFIKLCNSEITQNVHSSLDDDIARAFMCDIREKFKDELKMKITPVIMTNKKPMLTLDFSNKSILYTEQGMSCGLSMTSILSVKHSELIKLYCDMDERFGQLCFVFRYWAKVNNFKGQMEFSSMVLYSLVIFYCQNVRLISTLLELRKLVNEADMVDEWDTAFCRDLSKIPMTTNKMTIIELLIGFFRFYTDFPFQDEVLCPRTGTLVSRKAMKKERKYFKTITPACIQDFFNLDHNIAGKEMQANTFTKFKACIRQISAEENLFINRGNRFSFWGLGKLFYNISRNHIPPRTMFDAPTPLPCHVLECNYLVDMAASPFINILQIWASDFVDLIMIFFTEILRFNTKIVGKWNVEIGKLSPFCEILFKVRDSDYDLFYKRKEYEAILNQNHHLIGFSMMEKEEKITKLILEKSTKQESLSQSTVDFVCYMDTNLSLPVINIEILKIEGIINQNDLRKFLKTHLFAIVDDSFKNRIEITID